MEKVVDGKTINFKTELLFNKGYYEKLLEKLDEEEDTPPDPDTFLLNGEALSNRWEMQKVSLVGLLQNELSEEAIAEEEDEDIQAELQKNRDTLLAFLRLRATIYMDRMSILYRLFKDDFDFEHLAVELLSDESESGESVSEEPSEQSEEEKSKEEESIEENEVPKLQQSVSEAFKRGGSTGKEESVSESEEIVSEDSEQVEADPTESESEETVSEESESESESEEKIGSFHSESWESEEEI